MLGSLATRTTDLTRVAVAVVLGIKSKPFLTIVKELAGKAMFR